MSNTSASTDTEVFVEARALHAFVVAIWRAAGSEAREAALVADHLVEANLAGHDSHGVGMIPRYVLSCREGELKLNAHAQVVRDAGAVLTIEGGRGLGQVVTYEAMELGIARAKSHGVCAVGLRNAHHIGRIGHWAEQCARAGLVSFHFVNVAGDPLVAPFGGIDRRFGTNPFCAAFPREGAPPLVLDFATSAIAAGKVRVAYNKGVPVPAEALIDSDGHPTRDPGALFSDTQHGALRAFGGAVAGHKGSGLAAMCEIFAGALSGGFTTREQTIVSSHAIVNCMTSVIVDPAAFDAPSGEREARAFVDWLKATRREAGVDEILLPGERETATRRARAAHGIPVDPTSWSQIVDAARMVGLPDAEIAAKAGGPS
ncbi:malate/lactate/ureidoglycolate dehydrogenase [Paraburkholderia acidisoli]|uniref:Malate/lactate/ureidoglycolate dehydrogenase n=1 Tax=Paraburkholderia acidisoli TaxID=2571748 RepID=A0A7Z2GMT1_9BURK|nr:malate/lactate/ureidoglycolate dehydrogenase [Paraburkholderia acidisoli]QGZ64680.1 malate/lactate/ureidoglycolate dehydrogenase [Paraburkholderia acidisoli]